MKNDLMSGGEPPVLLLHVEDFCIEFLAHYLASDIWDIVKQVAVRRMRVYLSLRFGNCFEPEGATFVAKSLGNSLLGPIAPWP